MGAWLADELITGVQLCPQVALTSPIGHSDQQHLCMLWKLIRSMWQNFENVCLQTPELAN